MEPSIANVEPAAGLEYRCSCGGGGVDLCAFGDRAKVVGLFDQIRDQLLRYLSTFALALPDSEEIIQETFLALFQHLQRGKPRHNLRGWVFRVAHNFALKKRQRDRRDYQNAPDSSQAVKRRSGSCRFWMCCRNRIAAACI